VFYHLRLSLQPTRPKDSPSPKSRPTPLASLPMCTPSPSRPVPSVARSSWTSRPTEQTMHRLSARESKGQFVEPISIGRKRSKRLSKARKSVVHNPVLVVIIMPQSDTIPNPSIPTPRVGLQTRDSYVNYKVVDDFGLLSIQITLRYLSPPDPLFPPKTSPSTPSALISMLSLGASNLLSAINRDMPVCCR
jgi:hypothetical protein